MKGSILLGAYTERLCAFSVFIFFSMFSSVIPKHLNISYGLQLIFIVAAAGDNMHNAIIYKIYDPVLVVYSPAP